MHRNRFTWIFLILSLGVFTAGCTCYGDGQNRLTTNSQHRPLSTEIWDDGQSRCPSTNCYETELSSAETGIPQKEITLAVLPFHGASEARDSGIIVSDVLANQLYSLGKYPVITPELVIKRLADQESESLTPAEIGAAVKAPYILTGRVTEYTYKAGVGETPVIGVTARLIDASSGEVLWSATQTGSGGGNWLQENSLSRLTVLICKNLADSLNVFLKKHAVPPPAHNARSGKRIQVR